MIKNYLKLGIRNLAKNRLPSAINILGLALAVGCCLVVFEFFDWSMHMDNFHHKLNKLFVIERVSQQNGNEQLWGNSPAAMGPMLKNDFPQIKNIARLNYTGVTVKQGDNVFSESVTFADDAFYNMFDFPIKLGDKQTFNDPNGIVLTEPLSQKLFGEENPLGKTISVRLNNNGRETVTNFTVKGVFEKLPVESSFHFSAIIPYSKMAALGLDKPGDWSQSTDITFIEADNEAALAPIQRLNKKYLGLYNTVNPSDKISSFHFQPLKTMKFHAYQVNNQKFNATRPLGIIRLITIAISILLLVYFNYMNIAIAAASTRLKEIGVRKVMGSNRKQIIFQFLIENVILCTVAVIIGLFLAKFIFIPWFTPIAGVELGQKVFTNYRTWAALFTLVIVSALSGAAYPSFYISAFKPVNIMKGSSKMGSNNRFRKSLLGFQFFLAFLAISTAIAFIQETKHIKARPWGYDPENNVVVTLDKGANYEAFKDELKSNNKITSVTGSVQALGSFTKQMVIKTDGKDQTVQGISALPGFATQLGISIAKGRDLDAQFETDKTNTALVNQAFLRKLHWTSAIGKTIAYEKHQYLIVGEVNDFHFENFQTPVDPLVMTGCRPEEINYAYVKTSPGLFSNAHESVKKSWKSVNVNLPFEYYYQDTVFDGYFNGFTQISQLMGITSIIMIIISVSGIFGLALLILGKKMKEISVRKVLGAGMGTIIYLINKEFLFAIGFAILFGFPLSWWITGSLFGQIAPESKVSFSPLILSFLSLIGMTAASVTWHIYKAHTANPTQYLKEE